ncbi:MAG TPA: hypothetical protein VF794_40440 [Archangium sp.]|uniref:hypothetical protein n=1 Tax=Archangium sp. TaxID=1872627 RepID=UPI002EDA584B
MTAEPRTPTVPSLQCPRCGATLPPVSMGSQIIRCVGCGAAMEVRVRTTPRPGESSGPPVPAVPTPGVARPRRRPMVEVAGPRRGAVEPVPTITVDIPATPDEAEPAVAVSTPRPAASIDVPWFAEDIERLPEADVDLGQLALESFEALPPLQVRLDVSSASRAAGTAPARPPGAPGSHSLGK